MRDRQHAIRITDRLPALLAINVPILTRNQVWVFKHQRRGFKRDPVLGTIRSVLVLVLIQARRHALVVYTKWYIRWSACTKR